MATSTTIYQDCEYCGVEFGQPDDPGRKRRFCSNACRQAAYRARVRQARRAREERERDEARRRADEQARRAREERRRRRARQDRQPPPDAGRSRPRSWCAPCGGERGPDTMHHDDAAHERAWRRYGALPGRRRARISRTRRRRAGRKPSNSAPSTACNAGRPVAPTERNAVLCCWPFLR
jgi:hypothetical protein